MANNQFDVIVVGAGPVGMTAGLALQQKGISSVVVEANSKDTPRPGSRAIFIHKASMELLEKTSKGLGFEIAHNGLVWPIKRALYQGKEVYMRNYGKVDNQSNEKLPPFSSLDQREIEKSIEKAGIDAGVEYRYNAPIEKVESTADSVRLTTAGGEVLEAKYVIGCDGGNSIVRNDTGLTFEGPRIQDTFLIVDVKEDENDPLPQERIFHHQHPAMGYRNVMYVPFKGHWRIDVQLHRNDDVEQFSSHEGVKRWLPKVIDAKYADRITWISAYRFRQVTANAITDENRRALLAGEAAHLFAPFGARGLNSGIPDALRAVDGIAEALETNDEKSRVEAIDNVAHERKVAADWNRNASNTALEHMQSVSEEMNMKRDLAASLSEVMPSLGRWLDEGPFGTKSGPPELTTKY